MTSCCQIPKGVDCITRYVYPELGEGRTQADDPLRIAQIHDGVMYAETESEGKRRRYQVDTVRIPVSLT